MYLEKKYLYSRKHEGKEYKFFYIQDISWAIVARGWSKKYKSWDNGSYFDVWNGNHMEALEAAKECFKDHVERIFYYM